MNILAKRIVLDADNQLFRKAHPVLLDIFCRGVLAAESKRLILAAFLSIVLSPIGWVIVIFKKAIHLAILLAVWWFLREEIARYGSLGYMLGVLAAIAIFYKEHRGHLSREARELGLQPSHRLRRRHPDRTDPACLGGQHVPGVT